MKTRTSARGGEGQRSSAGMTLAETVVSIGIAAVMISGTINGYILSTHRAEWSAQSLAAHALALQRLEQIRSAKWDTAAFPGVDNVTSANFPDTTNLLELPISGTNVVNATLRTAITTLSSNPPLKMIRIDCIWRYLSHGTFTNTVISYRAPDQ